MTWTHPFEKAGLGVAPFQCIGHQRRVGPIPGPGGTEIGAPGQPMGTCDYCGTGIADCYVIRSSNGETFIVGSDCVARVGAEDPKLYGEVKVVRRGVERAKREVR